MDDELLNGLKNFDAVWRRVSSGEEQTAPMRETDEKAPKSSAEASRMREFMQDEANDSALYREMSARTRGKAATQFLGMSLDERRHLSELQLEYFLLTGDTYDPKPEKPEINGFLSRIRQSYISEGKGAEAYRRAAANTENDSLRRVYASASKDEARHAEILRQMIRQTIK